MESRIDPSISFMLTRCRRYAREYCVHVEHEHVGIEGSEVPRVLRVLQVHPPRRGERGPHAGRARRQDAVEHVHAERDRLQHRRRIADAHQVAGLVGRHGAGDRRKRLEHQLVRLADRVAADAVAGQVELRRAARRSRGAGPRRRRPARCRRAPGLLGCEQPCSGPPTRRCARRRQPPAPSRRGTAGTGRAASRCRRRDPAGCACCPRASRSASSRRGSSGTRPRRR